MKRYSTIEEAREDLVKVVKEAASSEQRRMIVLAGNAVKLAPFVATSYAEEVRDKVRVLFTADRLEGEETPYALFKAWVKDKVEVKPILYESTDSVLGTTWSLLFMDLTEQLRPNDLGRLVELVRGGGLVVLMTPSLREWPNRLTRFQRKLIVPPYTENDVKRRFIKRFIRKLSEHPGIWVLDDLELVSGEPYHPLVEARSQPTPPPSPLLPRLLYEMAKTQDQIEALTGFENLLEDKRKVLVLIANRGRGKSAALGLGAAGLIYMLGRESRVSVKVTAPDPQNVAAVFEFAEKALRKMKIKARLEERGGTAIALRCKQGWIEYCSPYRLIHEKADVALVDEAAGIPVPLLFKIMKTFRKVVYSSTIHGYEGAGRGFGLRFLKSLREEKGIDLVKVELKEPIRYAPDDPIEEWLYDTLLLNAEPPQLTEAERSVAFGQCIYEEPDLDSWFLGEEEEKLREFIGIYVFAHYRNRPDDIELLGDAPHHKARVLKHPSGKAVVALHLAEEGVMPDEEVEKVIGGYKPPGNIIPVCVARYYTPYNNFVKLRGLRIVRIATHPELIGRGLGSKALNELCKEAKGKGYEWIGAGFGGSRELLSFWVRNGFVPIHISPTRNMVSGEFSVVVVKPLTARARKLVERINKEFKSRLVEALSDPYFNLETSVARLLLANVIKRSRREPSRLLKTQWSRALLYTIGTLTYEASSDAVKELLRIHFLSTGSARLSLSPGAENLLIAKCLQGKPWSKAAMAGGVDPSKVKGELRGLVKELLKFYGKEAEAA